MTKEAKNGVIHSIEPAETRASTEFHQYHQFHQYYHLYQFRGELNK
jgi:hypothetical protein